MSEPRGFGPAPSLIIDAMEKNVETVSGDAAIRKATMELEKFMNELVVVNVPMTSDINAMPYVHLNVNGTNQIIPRGARPVAIKRMFLEVLARMKETSYRQHQRSAAELEIVTTESIGQVYPFNVVLDPNPIGHAWLAKVMAEAN
jgi:hypothetical protein